MTHADVNSRSRILHLVVTHGSDQYDIYFRMDRPALVRDLMEELEKKCHVMMINQQVFYRGQRLHDSPNRQLDDFGIFNGNRINLVGEKLSGIEDDHFRHLLNVEKDVKLIDGLLELICRQMEELKQRHQPRSQCEQFLQDLHARTEHCRSNLQACQSSVMNINVTSSVADVYGKKHELNALIRDRLDIASNVIAAISSYHGGNNDYQVPTNDHYLFYKH